MSFADTNQLLKPYLTLRLLGGLVYTAGSSVLTWVFPHFHSCLDVTVIRVGFWHIWTGFNDTKVQSFRKIIPKDILAGIV